MKKIKTVYYYEDSFGNEWLVYQETLPKKKGEFNYWIGECADLRKSFREQWKKDIMHKIRDWEQETILLRQKTRNEKTPNLEVGIGQ